MLYSWLSLLGSLVPFSPTSNATSKYSAALMLCGITIHGALMKFAEDEWKENLFYLLFLLSLVKKTGFCSVLSTHGKVSMYFIVVM